MFIKLHVIKEMQLISTTFQMQLQVMVQSQVPSMQGFREFPSALPVSIESQGTVNFYLNAVDHRSMERKTDS